MKTTSTVCVRVSLCVCGCLCVCVGVFVSVGVCVYRSVGEIPACAEFDCSLLEDTDRLNPREIELNDLTLETIQHK